MEETPKAVTALAEEETTNDHELEIDDDFRPEDNAVRDGGGSGGSVLGDAPYEEPLILSDTIVLQKLNENGQPMSSVVFRVTNTTTDEYHLLVTDDEGCSGTIFLAPQLKIDRKYLRDFPTFQKSQLEDPSLDLTDADRQPLPEAPDIFKDEPDDLNPHTPFGKFPKGTPNANDAYKDKESELYDIENLNDITPGGELLFRTPSTTPIEGDIKLAICYYKLGGNDAATDGDPDTEIFYYKGRTAEDMKKIDKDKLKAVIQRRFAARLQDNNLRKKGGYLGDRDNYISTVEITFSPTKVAPAIYKFEELRTSTNVNYGLKTFFLKSEMTFPDNPSQQFSGFPRFQLQFFVGESEENIDTPIKGLYPLPCEPNKPYPPGTFCPGPNPFNPDNEGPYKKNTRDGMLIKANNERLVFDTVATSDGNPVVESESEKGLPSNKFVEQSDKTTVVDKITYKGLAVGKNYKFVGKVYRKLSDGTVSKDPVATEALELANLPNANGNTELTFTFDSTTFKEGDKFVILYEIYENGLLAGGEDKIDNEAQSFTLKGKTTPPPDGDEPKDPPTPEEEEPKNPPTPEEPPKPEEPPTPEEPPKPEVPHVRVPIKVSMPPVRIPTAGVGR